MKDMQEMALVARKASFSMPEITIDDRNTVLCNIKKLLEDRKEAIWVQNALDMKKAREENLAQPLMKRLKFDEAKLSELQKGLDSLLSLKDPIGQITLAREIEAGMNLYRVTCPIGVLGIIFESRPDALIQIGSLCVKSGNCLLLKGGSEAANTNRILFSILEEAARGIFPDGWCGLMESRDEVGEMLKMEHEIDLIIPRGSNAFVRYIMNNTNISVMGHAEGICHTYIDKAADIDKAIRVTVDAKTQALAVCNATETLLVHEEIARQVLPKLKTALEEKNVELRGCERTQEIIPCKAATQEDWTKEYLDAILSIKVVESEDEAIAHINKYGSHHTDAIITEDDAAAKRFFCRVDSAGVYKNCSTRFADGYRYGFGAEVGISTGKLHARGPVGLEGLCTYKYVIEGNGETVEDTYTGKASYTHRDLPMTNKKIF